MEHHLDEGQRETVIDGEGIQIPKVHTHPQVTTLLRDKQNWSTPRRYGRLNPPLSVQIRNLLFHHDQFRLRKAIRPSLNGNCVLHKSNLMFNRPFWRLSIGRGKNGIKLSHNLIQFGVESLIKLLQLHLLLLGIRRHRQQHGLILRNRIWVIFSHSQKIVRIEKRRHGGDIGRYPMLLKFSLEWLRTSLLRLGILIRRDLRSRRGQTKCYRVK